MPISVSDQHMIGLRRQSLGRAPWLIDRTGHVDGPEIQYMLQGRKKMMRTLLLALLVVLLAGCGAAHVRTDYAAPVLSDYERIQVQEVSVSSTEQKADLLSLNQEFSDYAQRQLEVAVKEVSLYRLVEAGVVEDASALVAETQIDVTYGSRAKRYWVGFGAGKGTVRSVLVLRDRHTGEKVLQLASDSDLTAGAFGGSMDATIRDNINALVSEFKRNLM